MGAEDMERQALNVFRMRLLGADGAPRRRRQPTLKDAINEAMRDWVTNVADTLLPARLGARPASVSADGARIPIGDRPRGARADASTSTGRLPDAIVACVGGGSNAMGIFDAFIDDAAVRLIGVEAGGDGIEPGAARGAVRRRQRGRAAGHAQLRAAGRRRQHRADAFDLGRPRLRRGRTRARVAARLAAAPSTPGSTTTRRSTAFQRLARLRRDPAGARVGARDRPRMPARASSWGRDADRAREPVGPRRQGRA